MHIILARYHLHLPTAHSLKDKRSILKRIVHHLRTTHNASVAEIGDHDAWQHADLAIVACSALRDPLERMERSIAEALETDPEAQLGESSLEWI